jgi:hypothetical protein
MNLKKERHIPPSLIEKHNSLASFQSVSIWRDTQAALRLIIPRPDLLPRKTFDELTGVRQVTVDNLPKVLDALYDPSDLSLWLRGPDGELLAEEKMRSWARAMVSRRAGFPQKLERLQKTSGGTEGFLVLFNRRVGQVTYPSREIYLRLFENLASLCYMPNKKTTSLTRAVKTEEVLILTAGSSQPSAGIVVVTGYTVSSNAKLDSVRKTPLVNQQQRLGLKGLLSRITRM